MTTTDLQLTAAQHFLAGERALRDAEASVNSPFADTRAQIALAHFKAAELLMRGKELPFKDPTGMGDLAGHRRA